jgi:hypothetical protein
LGDDEHPFALQVLLNEKEYRNIWYTLIFLTQPNLQVVN